MKRIDWADQVAKGNYTIEFCPPVKERIRQNICPPHLVEEWRICDPIVEMIRETICTPSIVICPVGCGIECRVDCMIVDKSVIETVVREEMTKLSEKNMAQYADLKKEIDVQTDAILKQVKAQAKPR